MRCMGFGSTAGELVRNKEWRFRFDCHSRLGADIGNIQLWIMDKNGQSAFNRHKEEWQIW